GPAATVWHGTERGRVRRCRHGEDTAGLILATRRQQLALGMKGQGGNWGGVLQVGGGEGRLTAIPGAYPVGGGQGTIAPVGAEEQPGDAPREAQAMQRVTAGEGEDRDLSLGGADGQALARDVPRGRADHGGVAGKGEIRLPLQVPEPAGRFFSGWIEAVCEQMPAAGMEGHVVLDPLGGMNHGTNGRQSP